MCPSCGVVTDHIWFGEVTAEVYDREMDRDVGHLMEGSQGKLLVSICMSEQCKALSLWIEHPTAAGSETELVYPHAGVRIPPAEGLEDNETQLYEEAAAVARISPRAASALVRVLLEALLKRHLAAADRPVKDKRLEELIDQAVEHLALSPTLKKGLTAIRKRGNATMHDPYGLTDQTRSQELPRLFQAVDQLVDELHVTPQIWDLMAEE